MKRLTLRREALSELELRQVVAAGKTPTLPVNYCLTDLDDCYFTTGLTDLIETAG